MHASMCTCVHVRSQWQPPMHRRLTMSYSHNMHARSVGRGDPAKITIWNQFRMYVPCVCVCVHWHYCYLVSTLTNSCMQASHSKDQAMGGASQEEQGVRTHCVRRSGNFRFSAESVQVRRTHKCTSICAHAHDHIHAHHGVTHAILHTHTRTVHFINS